MQEAKRSARRNHALELKKAVLDECHAGASVASVAMAHGLNANLVHEWRRLAQGKLVAAVTPQTLQSAKLNGHDLYAYLKDVLTRLPTQPAGHIEELLPHR